MSYVITHLMNDEKIIYQTKLHWFMYVAPVTISLLGLPILFQGAPWITMFGVIAVGFRFLTFKFSEFVVTNKRIIIKFGFISRKAHEMLLPKIESVTVHQSFKDRILGSGSIEMTGVGGSSVTFANVDNPMGYRKAVYEQIEALLSESKETENRAA